MRSESLKHLETKSVWRAEWEHILLPYFPKDKLTLDCGCGPAYYKNFFGNNYIGIDVQRCFPNEGIYVRGSVVDLPFHEASFEFVLASALLEHIENPNKALSEICRVLKKKGNILLGAPSRYGAKYETLKTFRGYNIEDLECLAHAQNLVVEKQFRIGGLFAIIFAEIENILRRRLEIAKNGPQSFEGESYYHLFEHSPFGRVLLKLRSIILRLTVVADVNLPFKAFYQGACIFATEQNTDEGSEDLK